MSGAEDPSRCLRARCRPFARFKQEAQVVAALNHPHIVTIFSIEEHEDVPQVLSGDAGSVNETVQTTPPDTTFRWSATDRLWIFNLKADLPINQKYLYRITLADQTTIEFAFTVR